MTKDWVGNYNSIYKTIGASNHTSEEREVNDFYATEPKAGELLMKLEEFQHNILEPACGEGHLSEVFKKAGYNVQSADLIDRGYGAQMDFFLIPNFTGDIITNPPYSIAEEFVRHALDIIPEGNKVVMFLKLTFLEGQKRKKLFIEYPPIRVWVTSSRLKCAKNGKFDDMGSSAAAYAWYIWEKGYKGETIIKWFN